VEASYLFKSIGLSVKVMGGRTVNRERECALAAQCIGKLPGLRLWSYGAEGAVACSAVVSRGVIEGPFFFWCVWHHAPAAIQQPPAVHCQAASSLLVLLGDSALANVYWLAVQFCLQTDHGSLPWNVACISVFGEFCFLCNGTAMCYSNTISFEFLAKAKCSVAP